MKGRYPLTEKLLESIESFKFVSQEVRILREFNSRKDSRTQNWNEELKFQ